jgi:ribosomal-protein-alanine N-acetyltransferase
MSDIALARTQHSDGAEIIRGNIESRSYHHPWSEPPVSSASFDAWFRDAQTERHVSLIARHRASNGIVGLINFSEIVGGRFQNAYTGYYGMVHFAGQGLMTQALKAAVHYAFNDLGLHRLEANIRPENARSIALVRRAGFRREGFSPGYLFLEGAWRSHERWAVCREDIDGSA